ncbi:MAG: family 10 glycosylhydrolase [Ignavibacteriales bacterium]|nr:family 10 glycosylhydrolase [Ignavibacteriales bacterium]
MKNVFILLLIFSSNILFAQFRETRAVWLATNYRLDWPPTTFDAEKQKQSLIEIFDDLKSKNFNTVFFQVRANGVVLFNSSFEPLSPYFNGEVDGDVSYDPLAFAIEQAHKRGLEIHAWLNMNLVFTGSEENIFNNPNHICQRKPEWIVEDFRDGQKSYWLDVGLPEVRNYLADLISELVENYDVDGINLDYIRYPGKNFDDDFSFQVHGKSLTRDEFRRNNITALVKEIYDKVKLIRNEVKVGASPIGVYRRLKGMNSWESYSELYQDSYRWLKDGIVDYLSPQIYWSMNENPKFDLLAKDWIENSSGRNIVLGIGAYKDNVKSQIEEMIKLSRQLETSGVAFFRYQNIKDVSFPSFSYKTLPAQMPWLDGKYPVQPIDLTLHKNVDDKFFTLSWKLKNEQTANDSVEYFSIYNLQKSNSELNSENLFDVIPADKNYVTLAIEKPKKVNYYFAIKSVNKVWTESKEASNTVEIKIDKMKELLSFGDKIGKPVLYKSDLLGWFIILESNSTQQIEIFGGRKNVYSLLQTENASVGKNIFKTQNVLKDFDSIKIVFQNEKKEFELKVSSL